MNRILLNLLCLIFISNLVYANQVRDISTVGPNTEEIDVNNYSKIYYVDQNYNSEELRDGSSNYPWKDIFTALKNINNQSKNYKIALFIASGVYTEATIIMKEYLDLYGGFNGNNWKRDIYENITILDGQHARRVVIGANHSRLDGFTIKDGMSRSHGGGILCDDTSPTISNCIIKRNYVLEPENFNHTRIHQDANHGAGIACFYNAAPIIRNNVFYKNRTSIGNGAGIAFYGWLRMKDIPKTEIKNNFMEGGLRPLVKNNVFLHNISGINDIHRTRSSNGAAISVAFEARPIIENNVIACNQAKGRSDAGGIYSEYFSYPTISSNWIVGNISDDDGGGIYTMKMGHAVIVNNYIAGNWTIGNGVGGIRISKEGRANILDNIIVHNQTGGGVDCVDGYMELRNNVIMHNKGKSSIRYSNHFNYFSSSIIENNTIRENENKAIIESFGGSEVKINGNNSDLIFSKNDNYNEPVKITNPSLRLEVENIIYNDKLYQTILQVSDVSHGESLIGRIIKSGDFWSVISKVEDNKFYVWGNAQLVARDIDHIEVLSNYEILK